MAAEEVERVAGAARLVSPQGRPVEPLVHAPKAVQAARAQLPGPPTGAQAAEETFARAVEHGDEHVIKFADTATDVYARTGNGDALAAAIRATRLIDR